MSIESVGIPDIYRGTCPETGDETPIIVHEDGPDECYHCGAAVEVSDQ